MLCEDEIKKRKKYEYVFILIYICINSSIKIDKNIGGRVLLYLITFRKNNDLVTRATAFIENTKDEENISRVSAGNAIVFLGYCF